MPWSIKKQNGKFCVVKDSDGSKVKCHDTEDKAKMHQKALYAAEQQLEANSKIVLEGPVLTYVAVTSKPHLDQRAPGSKSKRIELVEIDGKKYVKVPMYRKGIYRHDKHGVLNFGNEFTKQLIENYQNKVSRNPVYLDFRHSDKYGSLAYLDPEDGGRIEEEADGWVSVYGVPTVDNIDQIIKQWPHASVEIDPNHKNHAIKYLSSEELSSITLEELVEDDVMPKKIKLGDVTLTLEQKDDVFQLSADDVSAIEKVNEELAKIATLQKSVADKEEAVKKLEADADAAKKAAEEAKTQLEDATTRLERLRKGEPEEPEFDLPPQVKAQLKQLEEQNKILLEAKKEAERLRFQERIALTIKEAQEMVDANGYGYTKPTLDLARKGLLLEGFETSDKQTIKLEEGDTDDTAKLVSYFRNLIAELLKVGVARAPKESQTLSDDHQMNQNGRSWTDDELKLELENFAKRY